MHPIHTYESCTHAPKFARQAKRPYLGARSGWDSPIWRSLRSRGGNMVLAKFAHYPMGRVFSPKTDGTKNL